MQNICRWSTAGSRILIEEFAKIKFLLTIDERRCTKLDTIKQETPMKGKPYFLISNLFQPLNLMRDLCQVRIESLQER